MARQESGGFFTDIRGRWHHADGRLMEPEEIKAAEREGTLVESPTPRQTPRRGRPSRPEPEPEEGGAPLEGSIRQFYALHEQMGECHRQMGEILETIVEELRQTLEPFLALANQFKNPPRAAAKVSAEPRRGGQGAVRKPDDRRLRGNRRSDDEPEEEPEEEEEDTDEEE